MNSNPEGKKEHGHRPFSRKKQPVSILHGSGSEPKYKRGTVFRDQCYVQNPSFNPNQLNDPYYCNSTFQ